MSAVQELHDAWHAHIKRTALAAVVKQGRSVTSVAAELHIRPSAVRSWLTAAGISLAGRPRPDVKVSYDARARALEQVKSGCNATQVAESLGVTAACVYRWVRAAGMPRSRHISKSNATRYSEDFKREAVKQVAQGRSVQTVCVESGVSHQTLRNWLKAAAAA